MSFSYFCIDSTAKTFFRFCTSNWVGYTQPDIGYTYHRCIRAAAMDDKESFLKAINGFDNYGQMHIDKLFDFLKKAEHQLYTEYNCPFMDWDTPFPDSCWELVGSCLDNEGFKGFARCNEELKKFNGRNIISSGWLNSQGDLDYYKDILNKEQNAS